MSLIEQQSMTTAFDTRWAEQALARARAAGEPDWSIDLRQAAAETARTLEFPSRTDELWRRTDFRSLEQSLPSLDPFAKPSSVNRVGDLPRPLASRVSDIGEAALIVQHNTAVAVEKLPDAMAKQGVIACSMERAVRDYPALVKDALGRHLTADFDRYTAIGALLRTGGAFVWVPDGVELEQPVLVFHGLDRAGIVAAPRTVVVLGRGARATVIEEQVSDTFEGAAFHLSGTELVIGDRARLVYGTLQDWGRNVYHYSNHRAEIGHESELQFIHTLLGGRVTKTNAYYDLAAPGAQAFVHGFMFGDGRQHFHMHTLQRHKADHCTSDLLIKGCLKDRARSVYQGLIQVDEGAQRTDAYQANRNLLLSDTARADSIPGLEILANDVRCTHGATIGTVDQEQMIYLMSRGLPAREAQRLIVEGFFAPVIDRVPLESVRDQLREAIQSKIGSS